MLPPVIFDLDGTLADTAPDIMATLNHLLVQEGLAPLPLAAARSLVGAGARALLERGFAAAGAPLSAPKLDTLFEAFLRHYADHIADHSVLFPGALTALERLHARGHRLGICTNKPERHARLLIEALGVAPLFGILAGRETFTSAKPDPLPLLACCEALGAKTGIMVGDSITDLETARAARMPVIGVSFGYTPTPMQALGPDVLIHHFDELDAAIATLAPRL